MISKYISLCALLATIIFACFTYNFYTTVLHPTVIYPLEIHKTLYLDETFDDFEVEIISNAAAEWQQATGGRANYSVQKLPFENQEIDFDNSIIVIKVSRHYPEVAELDFIGNQITLGYCNSRGSVQYIALVSDRLSDNLYQSVMLHELGHSLGLQHNDSSNGVGTLMYPSIEMGSQYITHKDLVNFCQLYRCDANLLHDQKELLHF